MSNHEKYLGRRVPVLVEGLSEESELLIQGRMETQAQEIDGHVLINDLSELEEAGQEVALSPGDLIEVEITEVLPNDLVGQAVRMISKARHDGAMQGLRTSLLTERGEADVANT